MIESHSWESLQVWVARYLGEGEEAAGNHDETTGIELSEAILFLFSNFWTFQLSS